MRIVIWPIFLLLLVSCSIPEKESRPGTDFPASSDKPAITITTNFKGALWMRGEILDFQLYEDGTVEFDDYPVDTPSLVHAEDVRTRKRYRISPQEVNELLDQISDKNFKALKERYELVGPSCDGILDRLIETRSQSIRIPIWCGLEEPPKFPEPLSDVLNKIRDIKMRMLGKRLPSP